MQAEEPKTYQNLTVSEEFPSDAMLAFMMMHGRNPQADPKVFTPQLDPSLAQIIFDMLLDHSAQTLLDVGLASPRPSTKARNGLRR